MSPTPRPAPEVSARTLLVLIPHVMQRIRTSMRGARGSGLSVPQFRTLAWIDHKPGTSLSEVAAHVGLGVASMSVLVTGLIRRGLARRVADPDDGRRMMLHVTAAGSTVLKRARLEARQILTERLGELSAAELATVDSAMALLGGLFAAIQLHSPAKVAS